MLPEIVAAVGGRAEIVLDGGIVRGSDVLKAIALGARTVAIGKLQGWGLAAAGQAGLVRVLKILKSEILTTMGCSASRGSINSPGPTWTKFNR
jgi:isopentenyl diphosphate isomerase/L-lactate dehydrogenase-like FMN-dependent dehydrogenase